MSSESPTPCFKSLLFSDVSFERNCHSISVSFLIALTQLPRPSARVGLSALPRAILRARSPFSFQHRPAPPIGPFLSECSHGRVTVFLNPPPAIRAHDAGQGWGREARGNAAGSPWMAWGPGGCESERLWVCVCGWRVTVRVGGVHVLVCVPTFVSVSVCACVPVHVCRCVCVRNRFRVCKTRCVLASVCV